MGPRAREIFAKGSDCGQAALEVTLPAYLSNGGGYSPRWSLWPALVGVAVPVSRVLQQGPAILGAASGMPQGPYRACASCDGTIRDCVSWPSDPLNHKKAGSSGDPLYDGRGTLGMGPEQVCGTGW